MNLDFKKEFKNPFKKFLTNIFLGISLLIVAFGGTIFGSQIFNSNKVDDEVNAALGGFRTWIVQRRHYDENGATLSSSSDYKYEVLPTEDNKWVAVCWAIDGTQGNLQWQSNATLSKGTILPGASSLKAIKDVPYPCNQGSNSIFNQGLQVKYQQAYFKPVEARNYGQVGITTDNIVFWKSSTYNKWFVKSSWAPTQCDLTAGSPKHSWDHTETVNGVSVSYKQQDWGDGDYDNLWGKGFESIMAVEGVSTTLYFNANGGSGASSSKTVYFNEYFPKVTKPTKSGYAFGGYYYTNNGSKVFLYDENGYPTGKCDFTSSKTLYAEWYEDTLPIVQFSTGSYFGTNILRLNESSDSNLVMPSTVTYSKTEGCFIVNGSYTNTAYLGFSNTLTFARGDKYILCYEYISGSVTSSSSSYPCVSVETVPTQGYQSTYTQAQRNVADFVLKNKLTSSTKISSVLTINNISGSPTPKKLRAMLYHNAGSTVTFTNFKFRVAVYRYAANLAGEVPDVMSPMAIETTRGSAYGYLPNVSKPGYAFDGWYKSNDANAEKVESTTTVTSSTVHVVYAHWKKKVNVTYNANGGNFSDGTTTKTDMVYSGYKSTTSTYQGTNLYDPGEVGFAEKHHSISFSSDTFSLSYTGTDEWFNCYTNLGMKGFVSNTTYTLVIGVSSFSSTTGSAEINFGNGGHADYVGSDAIINITGTGMYKTTFTTRNMETKPSGYNDMQYSFQTFFHIGNNTTSKTVRMSYWIAVFPGGDYIDTTMTDDWDPSAQMDPGTTNVCKVFPTPTRDGYKFLGWFTEVTESSGNSTIYMVNNASQNVPVEDDHVLYARWQQRSVNVVIKNDYDMAGYWTGTVSESGEYYLNDVITFGFTANSGFSFIGWTIVKYSDTIINRGRYGSSTKSYTITSSDLDLTDDNGYIEIHPDFSATINYYAYSNYAKSTTGGSVGLSSSCGESSKSWLWDSRSYNVGYTSTIYAKPNTGYKFIGFYLGTAPTGASSDSNYLVASASECTLSSGVYSYKYETGAWGGGNLYAVFVQQITVSFNTNGGGTAPSSITVSYKGTYGTLPTVSRTNYTFGGWWTASSGGTRVTETTQVTNTSNHTLYAHWTGASVSVTLNANGGSFSDGTTTQTKTVEYGSSYGTLSTPTRSNYAFMGWFTSQAYANSLDKTKKVKSSTSVTTATTHTLYAGWLGNNVEVTYDGNGGKCYNDYGTITPKSSTYPIRYDGTYYSSTNFGVVNSIAMYKWTFTTTKANQAVVFEVINQIYNSTTSGEVYGYSVFGILDSSLPENWTYAESTIGTTDNNTTTGLYKTYRRTYSTSEQSLTYTVATAGEHFIWFGYRRVSPASYNNDCVKVRMSTNLAARGSKSSGSKTLNYGSPYYSLPGATKTGYTLAGWYDSLANATSAGTTGKVTSSTSVTNASAHTLYAGWAANAITFNDQTLAEGTKNIAYSKSFTGASNGSGTYSYAIISVTNNGTAVTASSGKYNGLSLSGTTISGTPTVAGTYVFNVRATDTSSSVTKDANITITINDTLTVPSQSGSLTYNGSSRTPTWSNYDSTKLTIGGTTSGTNAGTYTATFTPKTGYKWSDGTSTAKSVTWRISTKYLYVTPATLSKTYGASDPTLTYTYSGNVSGETPKFTGALTRASGENVGTYAISKGTLALADNGTFLKSNYFLYIYSRNFTINKANSSFTFANKTVDYDGTAKTITASNVVGGTITYSTSETGTYSSTALSYTNAGTYTIWAKLTGDSNHNDLVKSAVLTINRKGIAVPTAVSGLIYNGSSQTGVSAGTGYTVTNGSATNAGDYTATVTPTSNYKWSTDNTTTAKTVSWSIAKFNLQNASIAAVADQTYTGSAITPTPAVTVVLKTGGTSTTLSSSTDFTYSYSGNTNVGQAIITITGKGNYTGTKSSSFNIVKLGVAKPTAKTNLTYTGSSQTGVTFVSGAGYSLQSGGATSGINAGSYTATFVLDGNHKWSDGTTTNVTITWTISPKSVAVVWGTTTSWTYDGTSHAPTATASGVSGETINLTVSGAQTNASANNYTATALISSVTGGQAKTTNYTLTNTTSTYKINARAITVTADSASKVYDGTALTKNTASVTSGSLVSGHTISYTVTGTITNVGSVTNTISNVKVLSGTTDMSANYAITSKNGTLTITARTITADMITLSYTSIPYDGTEKTPSVTVKIGTTTISNTNYTVEYSSNKNVGTATVTVTGKTNLTGSASKTFEITSSTNTVSFDANGGSCSTTSQSFTYPGTYGTLPTATRTGYIFAGWWTDRTGGTLKTETSQVASSSSHTLYAHWTANNYNVTFNANGGSLGDKSRIVKYDSNYGNNINIYNTNASSFYINDFSMSNNIFSFSSSPTTSDDYADIWTNPNSNIIAGQTYTYVIEVLTWKGGSSLTFNLGETAGSGAQLSQGSVSITGTGVYYVNVQGKSVTNPTYMGRDFITVPAGKTINVTMRISLFAGTAVEAAGSNFSYVTYDNAKTESLPTPTRSGYNFVGWFTTKTGTNAVSATTTVTTASNHTLYAHWEYKTIAVTITKGNNISNITGSSANGSYKMGDVISLRATPNTGYHFATWSVTPSKTINFATSANTSYTITEADVNAGTNLAFSCSAVVNSYTIKFYVKNTVRNSLTLIETKILNYGASYTKALPTEAGFTTTGWFTNADFSGTVLSTTLSNLTTEHNAVVNLFAKQEQKTITVTITKGNNIASITGSSANGTYKMGDVISLRATTSIGYHFASWSVTPSKTINYATSANTSYQITEADVNAGTALTFTATGAINTYTVKYWKVNGGTVTAHNTQTQNFNASLITKPTSANYTVTGWFTLQDGTGTAFTTLNSTLLSALNNPKHGETINLYAILTPETYTITYILNGSTFKTETYTYGLAKSLLTKDDVLWEKEGSNAKDYVFFGWFTTEPSGNLKTLAQTTSLTSGDSGNKTFYARYFKARAQGVEGYSDASITLNVSLGAGLKTGENYGTVLVEFFDEDLGYTRNYTFVLTNGTLTIEGLKYADVKITIITNMNAKANYSNLIVTTTSGSETTINVNLTKSSHYGFVDVNKV